MLGARSLSPGKSRAKSEMPPRPQGFRRQLLSHVPLCVTPWTMARQAPLSMRFPRQEYGRGPSAEPLAMGINSVPLDGKEGRGLLGVCKTSLAQA